MKKFRKFLKFSLISLCIIFAATLCGGVIFYHVQTRGLALDETKLEASRAAGQIQIFDANGNSITKLSQSFVPITKLSQTTKDAFITAEDKRFYRHGGIDLIRMAKATLHNLTKFEFSQGASTISQQLIKNTQLSSEKTISRKLKEIKLTFELEKNYSKDQILEMYLNNIYFGNGCYGIESASKHYFSKPASNLSLAEAAALAASINAPSVYDLEDHPKKVKTRRNLILDLLQKSSKISEKQCQNAKSEEILLNLQSLSGNNFLFNEVLNEAVSILKTNPNNLANQNIKIYTNLDLDLASSINANVKNNYSNLDAHPQVASIVIDNNTKNIISITGNKNAFIAKKQPGSAIKPILVFAPAIEKNIISPATKILDEPINISGYSPKNSGGNFHGFVSCKEALANSLNIPAVKILNEVGIKDAQNFAKKLGIEFSEGDNNLAIALGGFTDGITLKSLADSYVALASSGNFSPSSLISKITKNNQTIYEHSPEKNQVMQDSTAFLVTDMLLETSKTGTAKRLKDFNFDIAAKTGTVGIANSTKNHEAFCVCYTTRHTILTYVGGTAMPESINGATHPTMLAKDILKQLYNQNTPSDFKAPKSVQKISIKKDDYDQNKIIAAPASDETFFAYFASSNLPQTAAEKFKLTVFNFENEKPILEFETNKNFIYEIIRAQEKNEEIISSSISNSPVSFKDETAKSGEIYDYFIRFKNITNKEVVFQTDKTTLKAF